MQGGASRKEGWLTPARVVSIAAMCLCVLMLVIQLMGARASAEADGQAALALIEQQPASVNVQAPPSLAAAMAPHQSVLSLSHCAGSQCNTLFAREQAEPCTYGVSFNPQCVAVRSKANVGYSLLVRFDLLAVLRDIALNMGAVLLVGGAVALWLKSRQAPQQTRAASSQQAKQPSELDALTGLLNRVAFEAALKRHNESGALPTKGSTDGCLMYFDLDRFKIINDTHGHIAGDVVLKTVAKRLKYTLGNDVLIGRLGGDEFAVLLVDVASKATIEQMGRVVIEQVSKPIQIDSITDTVGLSIGAYMIHRGEMGIGDMLHRADLAMYEAKRTGRGRLVFFEEAMDTASRKRAQIQADLKKALEERQMFMAYQPQFDAFDSIRGVESLVRWRHPTRGVVSPDEFIPVAEANGLIVPLGKMVIDMVCADLVALRAQRLQLPYVSMNVSLRQLSDPAFVTDVQEILQRHGLQPTDIEFEITESTAMGGHSGRENVTLRQLSEQGFRIAIDDFGSGYSSIARLQDLKVDKLKIDRVFVQAIGKPNFDPALLELMITLTKRLGIKSVAEGVESVDQVVWLRQAGCQMMQGNLYAEPMTHGQLINWMRLQEGDHSFDDGVWAPTQTLEFAEV